MVVEDSTIPTPLKYPSLQYIPQIVNQAPSLIFIDFGGTESKDYKANLEHQHHLKACLHLSKTLRGLGSLRNIPTVGLHHLQFDQKDFHCILLTGINCLHIKSLEVDVIARTALQLTGKIPDKLNLTQKFPTARETFQLDALLPVRIGYGENGFFRFETSTPLPIDSKIEISHHCFDDSLGPVIGEVHPPSEGALFYNYRYAYQVPFTIPEGKTLDLEKYKNGILPKTMRVLAYDPELHLFSKDTRSHNTLSFTLKVENDLKYFLEKFAKFRPHIVISKDLDSGGNIDTSGIEQALTDLPSCQWLHFSNTPPASPHPRQVLIKQEYSIKNIIPLVAAQEQPIPPLAEHKIFFKNYDTGSLGLIKVPIKILSYNEEILTFEAPFEIEKWCTLELTTPLDGLLTVLPHKDAGSKTQQGIIHHLDDEGFQNLRKLVNRFFTKEKEQQRLKDKQELEAKNQDFLDKKKELKSQSGEE